jgi:hypothetical protein
VSFDRIREFVLSHAFLFRSDGGEVDGSGATQDAVFPVLRAHPNLNPMGALRKRRRGQGGKDGGSDHSNGNQTQEIIVAVIRRRSPCTPVRGIAMHSSPDLIKAAVLGVLFAPYKEEDGRECTYYERSAIAEEYNGVNGE